METKEAILSTISELNNKQEESVSEKNIFIDIKDESPSAPQMSDEMKTLLRLKEKSLVLFEGLKSSNLKNNPHSVEMKLEMIINYLEYQLYIIDDRLKSLMEK